MEVISTLIALIYLLIIFVFFICFVIISYIIYTTNKSNVKLLVFWIFSYYIPVFLWYPVANSIDSNSISYYLAFNTAPLLFIASIFYIIRIEERGFKPKYLIGFIVSLILFVLIDPQFDFTPFYLIHELQGLLTLIFPIYYIKILSYNRLNKRKKVNYPIILFLIPLAIVLSGAVRGDILSGFRLLAAMLLMVLLFTFLLNGNQIYRSLFFLEEELLPEQKKKKGRILSYLDKISTPNTPVIPTNHPLLDILDEAITNNKVFDFKKYTKKQIELMAEYINIRKNEYERNFAFYIALLFLGVGLLISPLIKYVFQIITNILVTSNELIIPKAFKVIEYFIHGFLEFAFSYGELPGAFAALVIIFIFMAVPAILSSFSNPSGRINIWFAKHRIAHFIYSSILCLFIFMILFKALLSVEYESKEFISFYLGLLLFTLSLAQSYKYHVWLSRIKNITIELKDEIFIKDAVM